MVGFSKIIGQEHIKEHLQGAIQSRMINHAYILQGEAGMGKKMVTYEYVAAYPDDRGYVCYNRAV